MFIRDWSFLTQRTISHANRVSRDYELDSPVLLASRGRVVGSHRLRLAEAAGRGRGRGHFWGLFLSASREVSGFVGSTPAEAARDGELSGPVGAEAAEGPRDGVGMALGESGSVS